MQHWPVFWVPALDAILPAKPLPRNSGMLTIAAYSFARLLQRLKRASSATLRERACCDHPPFILDLLCTTDQEVVRAAPETARLRKAAPYSLYPSWEHVKVILGTIGCNDS